MGHLAANWGMLSKLLKLSIVAALLLAAPLAEAGTKKAKHGKKHKTHRVVKHKKGH